MRLTWAVPLASAVLVAASTVFAHAVSPPRPLSQAAPAWPGGIAEGHDVVVPVVLVISEEGRVTNAAVEASVSESFDVAALAAAETWTFEPALRDGKPVAARVRHIVRFVANASSPSSSPAAAEAHGAAKAENATAARVQPPSPREAEREAPGTTPPQPVAVTVTGVAPPRSASETLRSRDLLAAAPRRTASDMLTAAPGVFVTQHGGEGKAHQIFLRGFDAVHGQDLELSVGGIPINEVSNIHGQGYADLHFAMPEVIKEVLSKPGPFDPRQGDFAVAGSIAMKLGYDKTGVTAEGSVGSFGARRAFLAYRPKSATDETFAAFEAYETDGFGPNRAARRSSAVAQISQDLADGVAVRVLATGYAARFDSAGVLRLADIQERRVDRLATYDPRQGGDSSRAQVLVELHRDQDDERWTVAPFFVARAMRLRQNFTGFFIDTQRGGADSLDSDNTQQLNDSVTIGANASYRRMITLTSDRDAIEAGIYARHDRIEQSQQRISNVNDQPTEVLVDAKVGATNLAGYLDASLHPFKRLNIRGGLRVDGLAFTTRDALAGQGLAGGVQGRASQGSHLGAKATADVYVAPGLHAVASYGEGFRSPQARGLSDGERAPFANVEAFEVGLRYAEANRIEASLAGFRTTLDRDLVFDPATARNEPVPSTERVGLALDFTARPARWLITNVNLTYTRASFSAGDARFGKGDLLPYVPQLVSRAEIAVERDVGAVAQHEVRLRGGMGMQALVRRPLPYGEMGEDVLLVDATAAVRWHDIGLSIDAFNLLDARFYDGQFVYPSNFEGGPAPLRVPQRHVTIGPPLSIMASFSLYLR